MQRRSCNEHIEVNVLFTIGITNAFLLTYLLGLCMYLDLYNVLYIRMYVRIYSMYVCTYVVYLTRTERGG